MKPAHLCLSKITEGEKMRFSPIYQMCNQVSFTSPVLGKWNLKVPSILRDVHNLLLIKMNT